MEGAVLVQAAGNGVTKNGEAFRIYMRLQVSALISGFRLLDGSSG